MSSLDVRQYLQSHALGLVAIFIVLTGTAVAANNSSSSGRQASASVVTDAKFKKLKQKVAALDQKVRALEGKAGPTIPASLPPSGPAGGALTGTYPSPLIASGAVASGQIANFSIEAADIASGAIVGNKFVSSGVADLNFGAVAGPSCTSSNVPINGYMAGLDHVLVTPPPGYPDTFTLEGHPVSGSLLAMVVCNTFTGGGSVDPDGANGAHYGFLVIRPS